MPELSPTQTRFFKKWSMKRKNKLRYIFIHGSVLWGLPVALTFILTEKILKEENLTILNVLITVCFFMAGGLLSGNRLYKQCEKNYGRLLEEDHKISDGVRILESEKSWHHENLIFSISDDQIVVVRNDLFWLSEDQLSVNRTNECFQVLMDDFSRLRENKALGSYLEKRKIKLQLFNNEDKIHPIAEKYI